MNIHQVPSHPHYFLNFPVSKYVSFFVYNIWNRHRDNVKDKAFGLGKSTSKGNLLR